MNRLGLLLSALVLVFTLAALLTVAPRGPKPEIWTTEDAIVSKSLSHPLEEDSDSFEGSDFPRTEDTTLQIDSHASASVFPSAEASTDSESVVLTSSQVDQAPLSYVEYLRGHLPEGAFPAVVSKIQEDAAEDFAVASVRSEAEAKYRVENADHGLTAEFGPEGVSISNGSGWTWAMSLDATGRGDAVESISDAKLTPNGNRVEYMYPSGLTEWYVNGSLGLQQGFTIADDPAPDGRGILELRIAFSGDVTAQTGSDGLSATLQQVGGPSPLRYTGLYVYDNVGTRLEARLNETTEGLSILVDDLGAQYPVTIDPFVQVAKLTPTSHDVADFFGSSIDVSGDTLIVGARNNAGPGNANAGSGAAYIFVKPSGGWSTTTETVTLYNPFAGADAFGFAVAIDGDVAVIGATNDDGASDGISNQGTAYVYIKPSGGWATTSPVARLDASDAGVSDASGSAVAIDGDTVVVGAPAWDGVGDGTNAAGAAYVFVKPGGGWATTTETARLSASAPAAASNLGRTVSIGGDTIVLGGQNDNGGTGAAYVFVKPGEGWANATETVKLVASDGAVDDDFGYSAAIDGDTIVVGARGDDDGASQAGSAYVFTGSGSNWGQVAKLTASDPGASDSFGYSAAIDGDTIVVGARGDDDGGNDAGLSLRLYQARWWLGNEYRDEQANCIRPDQHRR